MTMRAKASTANPKRKATPTTTMMCDHSFPVEFLVRESSCCVSAECLLLVHSGQCVLSFREPVTRFSLFMRCKLLI